MKTVITISCLLLTSCAFFQSKPFDETALYLSGQKPEASVEEYEKNLTRNTSMGGGYYQITAKPLVKPLIIKRFEQTASLRGFSPKEKEKALAKINESFLVDKTCFEFQYEAVRFSQVANLSNWELSFINANGDTLPLKWQKEDLKRPSVKSKTYKAGLSQPTWLGQGIACGNFQTDFKSGFALKVKPAFVQFPFSSNTLLSWEFPERIKIKDSETGRIEEKWEEKKKRSYKRYRGW